MTHLRLVLITVARRAAGRVVAPRPADATGMLDQSPTTRIAGRSVVLRRHGSTTRPERLGPRRARGLVRSLAVLGVVSIGALGLAVLPAQATTPTMQDLGTLGGTFSQATAVSGGIVVGWAYTAGNTGAHAFAYDLGAATPTMQDLGTLGGTSSRALAVSGGIVVGYAYTAGDTGAHAFAYDLTPATATATATTIASSANPSVVGAQVTYTATVTPVPDGGTAAFKEGSTTIAGCGWRSVDTSTGQATCQVTYTEPGAHSVTADYTGTASYAASTSAALSQQVAYKVRLLYSTTKPSKSGAVAPIKLQLLDAANNNLTASRIAVTVTGLSPSPAPGTPPSGAFTFLTLTEGPGYQLNVKTTKYPPGTYTLFFTAGTDPTTHTAQFVIK